ncbi:hypothetical protein C5Y96_14105 [Blastopirellula marina]|uniref:Uncharacterized protein n=1 Tax=Blastopirellula marina TaxID=124 RepID=A0A2S8FEL2_9BACT|nr:MULTISPECIES: hypothetical protein [Pirellulaceae]PQO30599.1 hypothetical protein C5Y96_14105 [Blastopirellula marina]RCS50736.1 hypothetical protein DTL36_14115 [Bremerella cremea]
MKVFRIHPEYNARSDYYGQLVNAGRTLMHTPQSCVGSVLSQWPSDLIFSVEGEGAVCDVLPTPMELLFSEKAKSKLDPICGDHAEWLPVQVEPLGAMYLFHPTSVVTLGAQAVYRQRSPGDNIIEVRKYDFDSPENLPPCFLIPQPESSPAGQQGGSVSGVFVTDTLRDAFYAFRGIDFACVYTSPEMK